MFYSELRRRFPTPSAISVTERSTLLVTGDGDVTIHGLELDGCLEIEVWWRSRLSTDSFLLPSPFVRVLRVQQRFTPAGVNRELLYIARNACAPTSDAYAFGR